MFLSVTLAMTCNTFSTDSTDKTDESAFPLWQDRTLDFLPETSEWTNRIEVADLNADGLPDLLFANGGNYSEPGTAEPPRVFLNQGPDQPFLEITKDIFGSNGYYCRVIKVHDVNGDKRPDIILGNTYQTQTELWLQDHNGRFTNETTSLLPKILLSVGDLELGDVDADGDLDITVVDWGPGNNMANDGGITRLWLNEGNGKYTDMTNELMPQIRIQFSWDLEFIDFDNDFDLDLVISCKRCGGSYSFVNDGTGIFTNERLLPAYTNNYDFEVMDVNGDGYMDLTTVNDGSIVQGQGWSRREHIFLNDSGRVFIDATDELWSGEANIGEDDNNIAFLDFDSDGDPDFLLSSLTGEDRLLVNDGNGKFQLLQPVMDGPPTPHTLSIVLADLNQDNKVDIIMGQGEGESDIAERIYLGYNIPKDESTPRLGDIATRKINENGAYHVEIRIHDNKTPNIPLDWQSIYLVLPDSEPVPMIWYGEHLWRSAETVLAIDRVVVCAIDRAGNQTCKEL